ncbi:ARM repeat-containing protein [Schizophyllum commune]
MNISQENPSTTTHTANHSPVDDRKQSPPAFLDLADSAARLGTNMSDISARVELKRQEHERQRLMQRKIFEDQMRALEQQQAQELLKIPFDGSGGGAQPVAVSAPTTPPRVNAQLNGDARDPGRLSVDAESLSKAVGSAADKRKSVTYATSTVNLSPDLGGANGNGYGRAVGAKSMPASRRTSASSQDEELAGHLQNLALAGERSNRGSPIPPPVSASILLKGNRFEDQGARYASTYNAGMMLDEQLDQEMHNAMRHLPTSDDDKYNAYNKQQASAALDLAHRGESLSARDKPSEWPSFPGRDSLSRSDRRASANLNLSSSPSDLAAISKLAGSVSATNTPLLAQHQPSATVGLGSRRASPPSLLDGLGKLEGLGGTTRSVPTTPLGLSSSAAHLLKTPGTPLTDAQTISLLASAASNDSNLSPSDLQASLSRVNPSQYDNGALNFSGLSPHEPLQQQYGLNSPYGLGSGIEGRYGYGFDGSNGSPETTGSTALYHHNGARYGLGIPGRGPSGMDNKMNGLHGPKHKRGDMDREFNRFAGTRLEDLQGEIPALCKDQHGCRYLQKKLEEGLPEHRDMIFRETFGHFADLMTDPFGNYLCQKLLEYSTDEQRNIICESVAQELVNISLNMHGTRAVQKMIDFLSTRRQTDGRYNNHQIHSIILALSMHVVVLIKDLNGNHVIQKCLNKLAPEDNQFIYNAVAANCVEVATHRHGCCVLQRCIDHASDHQRIQLVNEITYNALTLVQDPYGNYVVQYILDLNDNRFSDAVIRQFAGNVCALSVQKFSSNVIEKCIRVAEHNTRKMLIDELLNRTRLEKLLRDSYGNYCVQTALDYAEPAQRALLVEGIRPVLPLIRNTPYGKRIQNKLQREQNEGYGGYHSQPSIAVLNNGGGRHMSPNIRTNQLNDLYLSQAQAAQYPGAQFGGISPATAAAVGMPMSAIDPYVLQGGAAHNLSHSPSNGFSTFGTPSSYGSAGLTASFGADSYQRSAFGGYAM